MNRLRTGDEVIVIAGRSKGQKGKLLKILSDGRLLVDNVNLVKKHVKPNPQIDEKGGIKTQEAPIQPSNVMLYNPASDKGERVGFKVLENGRKVRVFKSNGETVDA